MKKIIERVQRACREAMLAGDADPEWASRTRDELLAEGYHPLTIAVAIRRLTDRLQGIDEDPEVAAAFRSAVRSLRVTGLLPV